MHIIQKHTKMTKPPYQNEFTSIYLPAKKEGYWYTWVHGKISNCNSQINMLGVGRGPCLKTLAHMRMVTSPLKRGLLWCPAVLLEVWADHGVQADKSASMNSLSGTTTGEGIFKEAEEGPGLGLRWQRTCLACGNQLPFPGTETWRPGTLLLEKLKNENRSSQQFPTNLNNLVKTLIQDGEEEKDWEKD